jgi:gluconokinase
MAFDGAIIVMGVASCGKTSVGEGLARALGLAFVEGDRLHPTSNVAKMSAGIALTDEDRWPWLDEIGTALRGGSGIVASCSALKKIYRDRLRKAAQRPILFVYLRGDKDLLAARIAARKGHFMPPSLLDSQFAILEEPTGAEDFIALDIIAPIEQLVAEALLALR